LKQDDLTSGGWWVQQVRARSDWIWWHYTRVDLVRE